MNSKKRQKKNDEPGAPSNKIVHLSPVPKGGKPMSRLAHRYGEVERTEILPEIASYCLYGAIALLLCAVIWAVVANIEMVAVAPGRLIPTGHVKVIQPQIDGVIENVLVKEGDRVTAGTPLVVLEKARVEGELEKRTAELAVAKQQLDGIRRAKESLELAIANPALPPTSSIDVEDVAFIVGQLNAAFIELREAELDKSMVAGDSLSDGAAIGAQARGLADQKSFHREALNARRDEMQSKIRQKELDLEQLKKALDSAKVELTQAQTIRDATEQQEISFRGVFQQGAVSRVDYLNILKELERMKRDVTKQETTVLELKKNIAVAQAQLSELKSSQRVGQLEKKAQVAGIDVERGRVDSLFRAVSRRYAMARSNYTSALFKAKAGLARLQLSMQEKTQKLNEAEGQFKIAKHDFSSAEIKAPAAGTVTGIRMRGKGHVIKRGDRLMSIVPEGASLAFEAAIPNKDAGFVEAGQDVKIKLAAYPFEDFGVLNGKVVHVEASAEPTANPPAAFIARIVPEQQYILVHGEKRPLVSGMTASCEIVTHRRPVMNLIFEPFRRMQETRFQ